MKIKKKTREKIENLVDRKVRITDDITLTNDFTEDIYSLFREKGSKQRQIRDFWDLFYEIKKEYIKRKVVGFGTTTNFYSEIKNFLESLPYSSLFKELNKLGSLEATRKFIEFFRKDEERDKDMMSKGEIEEKKKEEEQQEKEEEDDDEEESEEESKGEEQQNGNEKDDKKPQKQGGKEQQQKGGNDEKGKPEPKETEKKPKHQDQKGMSADSDNLPIDMAKFKQRIQKANALIQAGAFDDKDEDVKEAIAKAAGIETRDLQFSEINKIIDRIPDALYKKELPIFEVARKHEETEVYARTETIEDSIVPDDDVDIRNFQKQSDILKLLPAQFAYDDETFAIKMAKQELLVRQYQTRKKKSQALYMLIDTSGSMEGTPSMYASGIALSLVRQAVKEKAVYFLRFFDGRPHELNKIKTQEQVQKMSEKLMRQPYSGGGTDIDEALRIAIKDIKTGKFEKSEIMLISDGEDEVHVTKRGLNGIKLHSTIINSNNYQLQQISDSYIKLDSNQLGYGLQ